MNAQNTPGRPVGCHEACASHGSLTSFISFVSFACEIDDLPPGVQAMATTYSPPSQPLADEEIAQAREASRQLARLLPGDALALRLITEDKPGELIAIPPGAQRLFIDVLAQLGEGRAVRLLPQRAELSTQEAADYLNVSRPYVVSLIEQNKLPARKVGTRRRIAFDDLVRFDEQDRARRRAALDELARIDQELGL
jgi:excisionase family DNA binding protein